MVRCGLDEIISNDHRSSSQSSRRASASVSLADMQQALGAGIRLAIPPEFSLPPPRGVPSVGEEPTATEDAVFESRFDVRRERDVLREECGGEGTDAGASGRDADGRADGQASGGCSTRSNDPTSLDATVRRIAREPDPPEIDKYTRTGYPRDAVLYAVATWGDDESKVVDFCEGFRRGAEMGLDGPTLAGALAACDNDVERAVASCVR